MNPCRCGHAWTPGATCRLGPRCEESYRARISGPLWDRLDIQIAVAPVKATDLALPPARETSADVAERVAAARSIQSRRYSIIGNEAVTTNARCPAALLEDFCGLTQGRHAPPGAGRGSERAIGARLSSHAAPLPERSPISTEAPTFTPFMSPKR